MELEFCPDTKCETSHSQKTQTQTEEWRKEPRKFEEGKTKGFSLSLSLSLVLSLNCEEVSDRKARSVTTVCHGRRRRRKRRRDTSSHITHHETTNDLTWLDLSDCMWLYVRNLSPDGPDKSDGPDRTPTCQWLSWVRFVFFVSPSDRQISTLHGLRPRTISFALSFAHCNPPPALQYENSWNAPVLESAFYANHCIPPKV